MATVKNTPRRSAPPPDKESADKSASAGKAGASTSESASLPTFNNIPNAPDTPRVPGGGSLDGYVDEKHPRRSRERKGPEREMTEQEVAESMAALRSFGEDVASDDPARRVEAWRRYFANPVSFHPLILANALTFQVHPSLQPIWETPAVKMGARQYLSSCNVSAPQLEPTSNVDDYFQSAAGAFFIFGQSGGGKTTMLRNLVEALSKRARPAIRIDIGEPTPGSELFDLDILAELEDKNAVVAVDSLKDLLYMRSKNDAIVAGGYSATLFSWFLHADYAARSANTMLLFVVNPLYLREDVSGVFATALIGSCTGGIFVQAVQPARDGLSATGYITARGLNRRAKTPITVTAAGDIVSGSALDTIFFTEDA